jgi:predicted esterase
VIEHMRASFGARIDEIAGHTLAGFSLGALAAVDAFQGGSASFRHLILIGAKVEPTVAWLRDARIKDVVLMAGQWDMMYQHMARKARMLVRSGVVARFFDLGPVGHQFPADINQRLRSALIWADS